MTKSSDILIIIPAYNEAANIGNILRRILSETRYTDVVVINDGSTDRTAGEVRKLGVQLLELPYNLGIGAAVQSGYIFAERHGYDYVVRLDADGQHEVTQIEKVLAPVINGEVDFAIGSRYLGNSSYLSSRSRRVGMKMLSLIVSWIVRQRITDTTSGFRALNRKAISFFARDYPDDYPEVEAIVKLHKRGLRFKEVGIRMAERASGESSITAVKSVYYMTKVVLAIFIERLRKAKRA